MEEDNYKYLVERYVEKKLTDSELEVFIHLMKQGELDDYIKQAMNKELGLPDEHNHADVPVKPIRKIFLISWPAAAAIIGITFCTAFYLINQHRTALSFKKSQLTTITKDTVHFFNSNQSIVKQVLPDKSTIWLQPQSGISYPSRFKGKLREVTMQGEAFFEVTRDAGHPFVITTGKVLTRVWGTSFRIRSVAAENMTKVSVLTGKVSVSVPDLRDLHSRAEQRSAVMLKPKEEATYRDNGNELKKSTISPGSDLVIWKKSNLSFENTPLSAIITLLNDTYKVHIQMADENLKNYHITADFNDKNLADILLLLCKTVGYRYSIKADEIIISKKR